MAYEQCQVRYPSKFLSNFDWMKVLPYSTRSLMLIQSREADELRQNMGKWEKAVDMKYTRGGVGVATVNGKIYAIGGSTEVSWPIFP
ncbi:MAG: hypothetical protein NWF09_08850, partial [Candidatus Bathyarchaeota archaeon]|nr:hypothetical protein [Candidatus Bathyarchaeota archaeon]